MNPTRDKSRQSPGAAQGRNRLVAFACVGMVAGMVGLAYAAVPLYQLFCQVTGYGGTTQVAAGQSATTLDETVTIRFDANVANGLNWAFSPAQAPMTVRIGETRIAKYSAQNRGSRITVGTAVYNVTPQWAGGYFFKIDCFCFTEQQLAAGERVDMPVEFYVDPEIVDDPSFSGLSAITLSYTFFPEEIEEPARVSNTRLDRVPATSGM